MVKLNYTPLYNTIFVCNFSFSWINLKLPFYEVFGKERCNLRQAVEKAGLTWEGRPHCGLDDAKNTARLLSLIMARGYKISITGSLPWKFAAPKPAPHELDNSTTNPLCYCGVRSSKWSMVGKPVVYLRCDIWTPYNGPPCHYFKWTPHIRPRCHQFIWTPARCPHLIWRQPLSSWMLHLSSLLGCLCIHLLHDVNLLARLFRLFVKFRNSKSLKSSYHNTLFGIFITVHSFICSNFPENSFSWVLF